MKNRMLSAFKIPYFELLESAFARMTISERLLLFVLTVLLVLGTLGMLAKLDSYVSLRQPASGGSFSEAIIGTPRFINPLLALTDSDRDLVMLTYSGLMRATGDGKLIPDMAESYTISEDGKKYTFAIKKNLVFHDGKPVTADDVLFTIKAAQNPSLKSTRRADWDGVTVEKTGDFIISFSLPKPYAPFLENTTIGILPKHLWESVKMQEFSFSSLNVKPIGSGPYKVDKISYNKSGIPKSYSLKAFKRYSLGSPYIKKISLYFLNSKEELKKTWEDGMVDAVAGISIDSDTRQIQNLKRSTYPRIFAVFFNQDKAKIFADKYVRKALDISLDKKQLINDVMGGFATPLSSAIPNGILQDSKNNNTKEMTKKERLTAARQILKQGGWNFEPMTTDEKDKKRVWKKDEQVIEFSLATANTPELIQAAEILKRTWEELGIKVKVRIFEANELNQNVIRARNYEALLFGEVVGRSLDLFAFWHSSQRDDPGLNIALYANAKMDKLLENARKERDKKERALIYTKIAKIMENEVPAVFLYSPDFLYILPNYIKAANLDLVATPSERFSMVHKWYIETNRVWNIFAK